MKYIYYVLWFLVISTLFVTAPLWLLFMLLGRWLEKLNYKVFPQLKKQKKDNKYLEMLNQHRSIN